MTLSQPAVRILMVLAGMLVLTATATLGLSTVQFHRDRRWSRRQDRLKAAFRDRLLAESESWDEWVADLSQTDRRVLESVMQEHLRLVEGDLRERIGRLAAKLGIIDRANRALRFGSRSDRLDALAWYVLLAHPPDPELLQRSRTRPAEERAIVARLLTEQDEGSGRRRGTTLICQEMAELSVFGIDTLYRLNRWDPTPLIETLDSRWTEAADAFLVQVLWVVAECDPAPRETSLGWIRSCLRHENPTVRAAATGAFAKYGWRDEIRQSEEWDALLCDPTAEVRRAAYRLLAAWGDGQALDQLNRAVASEPDARARLAGVRALVGTRDPDPSSMSPEIDGAHAWIRQTRPAGQRP